MEKYRISNHLIFALVMQDKEICKKLLERIFNGKTVKEIVLKSEINLDEYEATIEKTIIANPESKSVRLDVLFEGDNSWYDIEMQSDIAYFNPKRLRYYSSLMDINQFNKGERDYNKLKTNYVIFICDFDYYQQDMPIYSFDRYDEKNKICFGDQSHIIILNAKCSLEKIPEQLKGLYKYVDKDIVDLKDDLVKDMDAKVKEYSKDRRLRHIMTLADELVIEKRIERELGIKEGIERGIIQGNLNTAKRMKEKSYPIGDISEITGLTFEEIEKL